MDRPVTRAYPEPMKTLVSPTPPLGWNSWDCYGASVREDEVLANAVYLAEHLKVHGWDTVVVDIQWAEPTADSSRYHAYAPLCADAFSRLVPAENRFPSAAGAGASPDWEKRSTLWD